MSVLCECGSVADLFNFGCVEVLRCVSVNDYIVRVWKCGEVCGSVARVVRVWLCGCVFCECGNVAEKAANWRRRVIPRDFSSLG